MQIPLVVLLFYLCMLKRQVSKTNVRNLCYLLIYTTHYSNGMILKKIPELDAQINSAVFAKR